jgi:hypothetical protein
MVLPGPSPAPDYCSPAAENAILRAVAFLGYPVRAVTVAAFTFACGGPFAAEAVLCPAVTMMLPGGYVSFVGTDKIAAVELGTERGGSILGATVVVAEVPPLGWSMP